MIPFFFILSLGTLFFSTAQATIEDHLKPIIDKPDDTSLYEMRNIDFIYLINLDKRPEKWEKCLCQLKPYNITPYRFSAVHGWELPLETINDVGVKFNLSMQGGLWGSSYTVANGEIVSENEIMHTEEKTYFGQSFSKGAIGIVLSHLSVLKDALDSGYETIWVMEDDIEVLRNPKIIPLLIEKLDLLVGEEGWDILFTDVDYRNSKGEYVPNTGYAERPNFKPSNPHKFAERFQISEDFKRVGARFGAHSMIVRRSGMRKIWNFIRDYSIFSPYDVDYSMPEDMHLFSLTYDVVSQLTQAISDNGMPDEKN